MPEGLIRTNSPNETLVFQILSEIQFSVSKSLDRLWPSESLQLVTCHGAAPSCCCLFPMLIIVYFSVSQTFTFSLSPPLRRFLNISPLPAPSLWSFNTIDLYLFMCHMLYACLHFIQISKTFSIPPEPVFTPLAHYCSPHWECRVWPITMNSGKSFF